MTNSCSIHSHAAFDLDLGPRAAEPITLRIEDLEHRLSGDLAIEIDLPARPQLFIEYEYGYMPGDYNCDYRLAGTFISPDVPDYI